MGFTQTGSALIFGLSRASAAWRLWEEHDHQLDRGQHDAGGVPAGRRAVLDGARRNRDGNTDDGDFGAFVGRGRGIEGAAVAAVWEAGELIRDPY